MTRVLVLVLALTAGFWLAIHVAQGPAGPPHAASAAQAAGAQAYLDTHLAAMPAGWAFDRFTGTGDVTLEVGRAPAEGTPKGTILYVPGYTAPLDMYGAEFSRMTAAGWNVAAISPRGQGRSDRTGPGPQMGWVADYALHAADIAAFAATLDGPVAVLATSMGGHIALRSAVSDDLDAIGLALIAPMVAIRTDPYPDAVARGIGRVFTTVGLGGTYALGRGPWDDFALFDDPAALARGTDCARDPTRAHLRDALFALEPGLRLGGPSTRWVAETYRSQDRLRAEAPALAMPVRMALAGEDTVVRTEAAVALCEAMADCEAQRFPESRHCMIEDTAETRKAVIDDALAFFEAQPTRP